MFDTEEETSRHIEEVDDEDCEDFVMFHKLSDITILLGANNTGETGNFSIDKKRKTENVLCVSSEKFVTFVETKENPSKEEVKSLPDTKKTLLRGQKSQTENGPKVNP